MTQPHTPVGQRGSYCNTRSYGEEAAEGSGNAERVGAYGREKKRKGRRDG